jgi:hypothetical protein
MLTREMKCQLKLSLTVRQLVEDGMSEQSEHELFPVVILR